jgi:hypothetical protein
MNQVLRCGMGNPLVELAAIEKMVRSDPYGRTPLCSQLAQVTRAVKEEAARLQGAGQRCIVVVASGMAMIVGSFA